jgi:hypothetical protein
MFNIKNLFKEEDLTETSSGTYKTVCPDCGLQGGRTEGFILYPDGNNSYCHSSHKHFTFLETYALIKKLIRCLDGNDTGEKKNILTGDLYKNTMGLLKEEYNEEQINDILDICKLKNRIELPNNGKLISTFANELASRIKRQNIFFYRYDTRKIVEVGKIKVNEESDFVYNGFVDIDSNRFITLIENYFIPWSTIYTKNGSMTVIKSMSNSIANIVLVSDNFRDVMPSINRIFNVQIPIIYKGLIEFPKPGYDGRFNSWLPFNAPAIKNKSMDLIEAKQIIDDLFQEFCFKSEQDKTNAIAAFITPFIRGLFTSFSIRTPVFIYEANRERAGKDYLAGLTGILYEGYALEEPPISTGDKNNNSSDELKKKILSAMIFGRKRLHFSNNKGFLNNAVFESVTTAERYTDRVLGRSEVLAFDNELDYSLSGNIGMTLTPDLANRSRFIRLFLDIEDANSREFRIPDLHGWLKKNRELVLSALYALIRNWIDSGSMPSSLPFASFPEWARICGGVLEAAGYGNPCVQNHENVGIQVDGETAEMKALFELCYEHKPDMKLKKADIMELIKTHGEDVFGYVDWNDKSDQTKFGTKLIKYVGRILSDIRLKVINSSDRTQRWEYVFCKETHDFGHLGHLGHLSSHFQNAIRTYVRNVRNVRIEIPDSASQVPKVSKVAKLGIPDSTPQMTNIANMTKLEETDKLSDMLLSQRIGCLGESKDFSKQLSVFPNLKEGVNLVAKPIQELPSDLILSKHIPGTPLPKTNREVQYYESKECEDIRPHFSKEELLEWLKANPDGFNNFKEMYEKFGVGSPKIRNELKKEGLI